MAEFDISALFSMSYGMYIIGTKGDKLNGQVANAAMQVTGDPVKIAVGLNKANLTEGMIAKAGYFSVSVLREEVPMTFLGTFGFKSGRDIDKFAGVEYETGEFGTPLVKQWCLSAFEARVVSALDLGTHTLFVGEVLSTRTFDSGSPLTYANYHLVKKGKSPKTAPTFGFNALK
jgi:ferric-chelate reductase [NAD(P)H]